MTTHTRKIGRNAQIAAKTVYIASMETDWQSLSNTSVATIDAVTTVAVTDIINLSGDSSRREAIVGSGTNLIVRLKYDAANTSTGVDPIIQVLGIDHSLDNNGTPAGKYHWLLNGSESKTATLALDETNDINDSVWKYTDVTRDTTFDLQGSAQFIIFIKIAFDAGTADKENNSLIEYKIV